MTLHCLMHMFLPIRVFSHTHMGYLYAYGLLYMYGLSKSIWTAIRAWTASTHIRNYCIGMGCPYACGPSHTVLPICVWVSFYILVCPTIHLYSELVNQRSIARRDFQLKIEWLTSVVWEYPDESCKTYVCTTSVLDKI